MRAGSSGSMPMTDLILVLQRSPEVQAEFDAFVASQYDPNSPNFHQWLTPEQVGEKFGPATCGYRDGDRRGCRGMVCRWMGCRRIG